MDNCVQVRARLQLLTLAEFAAVNAQEVHLQSCADCRQWSARALQFDAEVRSALNDVPVPAGLEARLLAAIEQATTEVAPQDLSAPGLAVPSLQSVPVRPKRFWVWRTAVAVALLLALGGWWFLPTAAIAPAFEFAELQGSLQEEFSSSEVAPQLTSAEGLDCTSIERELARLRLANPRGLELDNITGADAAVYEFKFKRWTGVLVAIPTQRLTGGPNTKVPTHVSHQRSFAWQSQNDEWTYLCYVHSGPEAGLLQSLFGGLA